MNDDVITYVTYRIVTLMQVCLCLQMDVRKTKHRSIKNLPLNEYFVHTYNDNKNEENWMNEWMIEWKNETTWDNEQQRKVNEKVSKNNNIIFFV